MEKNACGVNQLGSDALLPPRKRLLAGLKKQNLITNGSPNPPPADGDGDSSCSTSNGLSDSDKVQNHLDNILTSHLDDPNLTPEEIAESSMAASATAAKAAKAARAAAEEKALIAAEAIAAAKNALELFYSFPDEAISVKERSPRRNKQKKHVPIEILYSNSKDGDLASRLHRAISSSYRILKTEGKGHKNKKHKAMMVTSENPRVESGCSIVSGSMSGEHDIADVVNSDSSNGMEADPTKLKDKTGDESNSSGKRRGRVKLKKLPLSICHTRDQENNKGEGIAKISESRLPEENVSRHGNNVKPLPRPESSNDDIIPIVSGPSWNCKDLKAPERSKQNKAVSS